MFWRLVSIALLGLLLIGVIFFLWPEKSYQPYVVDTAYQAQVDHYYVPPMPPDWTWQDFKTTDGTRLRWGETGNRYAAKATLLWVPGYTATLDMYGEPSHALAQQGFHVIGLDLRGQGGSQRERADFPEKLWVDDFSVYSDDVANFLDQQALPETRPVIVLGISFGGHVVTRMAVEYPHSADALFLLAPAWQPRSDPYTFAQARQLLEISRIFGKAQHYAFGQGDWQPDGLDFSQGSDCSSNPKRLYYRDVVFTRDPKQRVGGVTNQWGAEFFQSSELLRSEGYLSRLNVPVTVISAAHDTFVVTETNSLLCRDVIKSCRELPIADTGHCLPQESDAVQETIMEALSRQYEDLISGIR